MRQMSLFGRSKPTGAQGVPPPDRRGGRRAARRGAFPRPRWRLLKFAALLPVVAAAIWLALPGTAGRILADIREGFVQATAGAGMTVQRVYTDGRRRTPVAAILAALGTEVGAPIFSVDPREARDRIQEIGWVERAVVERRLPSTVYVHLVERTPSALWQRDGRLVVVDRAGTVIGPEGVTQFAHLPVIVGDDAPRRAPALLDAMAAHPALSKRVRAAIRMGGRRWNLRFDTGLEARLPEGEVARAWARLVAEIDEGGLLDRPVEIVDLRLADRTILRLRPPAAADENRT